jgi:hypothetical protein
MIEAKLKKLLLDIEFCGILLVIKLT